MHDKQLQKIVTNDVRALRRLIGGNIHRLRAQRRLPLAKFADLCHMNMETIDRLEIGKDQIGLEHLARIARALNVGIGELVQENP